jgi:hypothetical protein
MKHFLFAILAGVCFFFLATQAADAQCSICAKSVQQMGTRPAAGFNSGILYLMVIPYAAIGIIGYRWWRSNR